MKSFKVQILISVLTAACTAGANAAKHVWHPTARALSADPDETQTVVITGTKINWGRGQFDNPFFDEIFAVDPSFGWGGILQQNVPLATTEAMRHLCNNRQLSASFRNTSGLSGIEGRWLAALAVFNAMATKRLLFSQWDTVNNSIEIIIDNKSYKGFKIFYSDESSETWVVNPGWQTSSLRLFDIPVPGSLNLGKNPGQLCPN